MNESGDSAAASDIGAEAEPEPPDRLALAIVWEGGDWAGMGSLETAIQDCAAALSSHPACRRARGAEAGVALASDAYVRRLNASYRGKDRPTNVLSFPFQAPPGAGSESRYLGDLVLACETIRREALERGIPPLHHVQHLVVHGLLHLLGHDHESDAQAEAMERLEAEILGELGIDPFADRPTFEASQ
jgi:probable rRNA maturation factor